MILLFNSISSNQISSLKKFICDRLVQSEFVDSSEKRKFYIFNTYLIEKLKANKAEKNADEEFDFEKTYNNVKKVMFFFRPLSIQF